MKNWFKKHDILTKGLALLIAIVLWVYVVSVVDPMSEITFDNIVPTYVGSEELLNKANLMVSNENLVSVRLSGSRRALASIDEEDVKVEVDISKIREEGTYELFYKVIIPSNEVSVVNKNPDRLNVTIDEIVSVTVPIKVVFEGNPAEGYRLGPITTNPEELSVTGRAEEVVQISYAKIVMGEKNLNTSIREQMAYTFCDSEDKPLELTSIRANKTVEVFLPVLKEKKVPLSVEIAEGGGAKEKNVSYKINPAEITIAGEAKVVDSIKTIPIGVVDLSKIKKNDKVQFNITMPEGVENLDEKTTADVSVEFNGLVTKSINTKSIRIINSPKGYDFTLLTESLTVLIRGPEEDVNKVRSNNVSVVFDLSSMEDISAGQHLLTEGKVELIDVANVGAVGEYTVRARVSK